MSRSTITGSVRDPKVDWNDLDIDELVDRLTPGEIQSFLDECDPDDPHIPPAMRCNYKCDKPDTGNIYCIFFICIRKFKAFSNAYFLRKIAYF